MLYSATAGFVNTTGFARVEAGGRTYHYSGIFYIGGRKAGDDSIIAFAQEYDRTGSLPFHRVAGAFSCVIVQPNGDAVFFTDNSSLHCFYVGQNAISDSFLELIRWEGASTFDDEALCEHFALRGILFGKTLVQGITTTASDSVYLGSGGTITKVDKGVGDIDEPTVIDDVPAFFHDMAHALADEKVTLSLTGGYDSRLVLACLYEYLPINVFFSGSDERDPDMYWARRAAEAVGKTLEVVRIEKPAITEEYLRELLEYADGMGACVDDNYMRISAFMQNRREQGYTCYLTGDGGIRHKDWYWVPDLPFYRRRRTNVGRFYDQRIRRFQESVPFGDRLRDHDARLRQKTIERMGLHVKSMNTQSYDAIGFHLQGDWVSQKYTTHSKVVPSYAPLWELELVRYSYHLPRRKRFFYNSMREIITSKSIPLARTPTEYGMTASSQRRDVARDTAFQAIEYARRATRLLGRTLLHRNLFVGHPTAWSAEADVRALDISKRAVEYCVAEGLIQGGTTPATTPYNTLGRMIHVYLLAQEIELGREHRHESRSTAVDASGGPTTDPTLSRPRLLTGFESAPAWSRVGWELPKDQRK